MPRAKVRPEDRQRSMKACIACKASKRRCDAGTPCSNCTRQKRGDSCQYPAKVSVGDRHNSRHSSVLPGITHTPQPQTDRSFGDRPPSSRREEESERLKSLPGSPEARRMTTSRMLRNAKGDRVYIGNSASLSFLQLLRQIFATHNGPSQFTESYGGDTMLEAQLQVPESFDFYDSTASHRKQAYVESYKAATSGLVDIFTSSDLDLSPYLHHIEYTRHAERYGAGDIVIAIGAQCCSIDASDLRYESAYFSRGQRAAFAGMLEDPSLDLTRAFILLAFYMLGACRRNAAFMYLGVAARAAHALGLHDAEAYRHFGESDRGVRLRIWKSVRILDFLTSSILGRPSATTPPQHKPVTEIQNTDGQSSHSAIALEASYRSCTIIDDIIRELCSGPSLNAESAKVYLGRLKQWRDALPSKLGMNGLKVSSDVQNQDQVIGNMHVACTYYFGVLLVTRPFLISFLLSQLSTTSEPHSNSHPPLLTEDHGDMTMLAEACVDSAIYMVQTCHTVLGVGLMLENMCILKAWIFAAGLIIGFSLFARATPDPELDKSFDSASDILTKLANRSPQARHYLDIFTNMRESIRQYHLKLGKRHRKSQSRYVDRIFALDVDSLGQEEKAAQIETGSTLDFDLGAVAQLSVPDVAILEESATSAGGLEDVFFGWDSFAYHFFDSVPVGGGLSDMNMGEGVGMGMNG